LRTGLIGLERPFVRDLSAADRQMTAETVTAETVELEASARPDPIEQPARPDAALVGTLAA
jgi:hypothetical protein